MIEAERRPSDSVIRVLLIEDDAIDREHLRRVLHASLDVSLQTACCLQDGIQLIRQTPLDVVLFDLGLPDSYGLDTIKRMVEEFPHVPLIVLTGLSDETTAREASSLGICHYLVKGQASASDIVASVQTVALPVS